MNQEVKNFTENNKCSNCGSCCTDFLPLSNAEKARIGNYVKRHNIKEQRHNFLSGIDTTCPFRDDLNKKCLIYEVRPSICRTFICNADKEYLMKNKAEHLKKNSTVCMRAEFFNSKEYDVLFGGNIKMIR